MQGMQNSFDHDFFHWIPDNGHNHAPIFDAADSSLPLRDVSSRVYDPLLHGTSSDVDHPQGGMGECHISNPRDGNFPAWHHTFTSTDLHPNHMASTLFSLVQHGMESTDMATMVPRERSEITSNNSHVQPHSQASNYET
ncbi:hypothetical protein F0562_013125 [Nyssa sinensis]|uniref:Uncharacterized protein n=1 Tax=Nyssa sinensis TaxID=561372 RepID=A0A5J4ZX86_9ASTE|nr:hypothetical protein F0562_013125 [Nyssa sinensis]